jgi:catechol 2,3-dioxygenase-like lactoylglutathione lyase family enzyme
MINHVMVGTNDLDRAKAFYDAVLGVLGVGEPTRNVDYTGHVRLFYGHDGVVFGVTLPIDGEPANPGNGGTIAFKCNSSSQVSAFRDAALDNGGTSIESAQDSVDSLGSIKTYVRDPDGNKLCAIHYPAN